VPVELIPDWAADHLDGPPLEHQALFWPLIPRGITTVQLKKLRGRPELGRDPSGPSASEQAGFWQVRHVPFTRHKRSETTPTADLAQLPVPHHGPRVVAAANFRRTVLHKVGADHSRQKEGQHRSGPLECCRKGIGNSRGHRSGRGTFRKVAERLACVARFPLVGATGLADARSDGVAFVRLSWVVGVRPNG
jgi:hypothetical protein